MDWSITDIAVSLTVQMSFAVYTICGIIKMLTCIIAVIIAVMTSRKGILRVFPH